MQVDMLIKQSLNINIQHFNERFQRDVKIDQRFSYHHKGEPITIDVASVVTNFE